MPLTVLIPMVVLGIAGIALLLHLAGRSQRCVLTPVSAEMAWLRQFPGDRVAEATVARDGHAALILTDHGPGLLWAFGADTVARRLLDYDLIDRGDRLRVVFHDFTAPTVTLTLDPFERRHWLNRMQTP
ncbi:hypothetical protein [Antarcticimicrobium luteum]|uniref:DUF2550 family protein n=1 Tax=Antarcticimicrobium luteum TaxID=2547397 RepID=A0A4R5UTE1_9RHOB|nr:hypothetical protein [Antarcticimicrobium luteum]TDK42311.1 hypothetical protein E1832_19425 [Antarcticimicrobium luteum]